MLLSKLRDFVLLIALYRGYFRFMEVVKYQKDNLFQRLKAHYINDDIVLTPDEIEKKKLLDKIWSLRINNKYSKNDIIKILQRPKERGGEGIPRSTAYRQYQYAMQLYGDIDALDYAAEMAFLREVFQDIMNRARKNGDLKAEISAGKEYRKLLPVKDAGPEIDPHKLEASLYRQILPAPVKKMFRKAAERGVIDLMFFGAEDAEFKEMNDEEIEEGDE